MVAVLFWLAFCIVCYTYAGYAVLAYLLSRLIGDRRREVPGARDFEPGVTLVVPCYNEAAYIGQKVADTLRLDYPADKLQIIFVSDGSTDDTPRILDAVPGVTHLFRPERSGKIGAMGRAMEIAVHPVIVFCDANTSLNRTAVREIVKHYADPRIGGVACEKRVHMDDSDTASSAGEGIYWKYESFIKQCDSDLLTIVGAAGELFSLRRELYRHPEPDTILDDFMLSMRVVEQGYKVIYEPRAYAVELASASVGEELKRKIRISAGGWQSMFRLTGLLNPFRRPLLWFIYCSHRVLRWSAGPIALFLLLPLNLLLWDDGWVYQVLAAGQVLFYILAGLGWLMQDRPTRYKILFLPFYFFMMNYAVILGAIRFFQRKQTVQWEKARRKS